MLTLESVLDIQRWGGGEPTAVGEGYSWMYKGRYYSVLYTRAGMFRGNHIHPNDQHTLLLEGKGRYVFREDGKNVDYHLVKGELLDVQAAATGATLNLLNARRDLLLAGAALDFAYGAYDR